MKNIKKLSYILAAALFLGLGGCQNWLEIKTLSEFTGENAFSTYTGMKTAATYLDRNLRDLEFYPASDGSDHRLLTELYFSELIGSGKTDMRGAPVDLVNHILPSSNLEGGTVASCHSYWDYFYAGIKDCNIIITRMPDADMTAAQRNEILARTYWHRAYRYYRLVHQFGDVPLLLKEDTEPRYDYYSTDREVTLRQMKSDLEGSIQYLPDVPNAGAPGKGAGYHLLAKICLALQDFDGAIAATTAVIDGGTHSLMKSRFGSALADQWLEPGFGNDIKNVIWDLHRHNNKSIPTNKEGLYVAVDHSEDTASRSTRGVLTMRQMAPFYMTWVKTPNGANGFPSDGENPYMDYFGRGIATARSSWYHSNAIWEEAREHAAGYNDLRHDTISRNWMAMENLTYNNPAMLVDIDGKTNPDKKWYGKRLKQYNYKLTAEENKALGNAPVDGTGRVENDTIRGWVGWPHYKSINPDDRNPSQWRGGGADWYVFRLAETYLLRAEAYMWKDLAANALADINAVRERAGARPFTVNEVSISSILDERARELYFEEPRKCELTRISWIYAKTGKSTDDPRFPSKTYTVDKFSTDNFFYDRIMAHNDFFYKAPTTQTGETYKIAPYHILWPVRETVINTNVFGVINQNPGYPGNGEAKNQPPIDHAN